MRATRPMCGACLSRPAQRGAERAVAVSSPPTPCHHPRTETPTWNVQQTPLDPLNTLSRWEKSWGPSSGRHGEISPCRNFSRPKFFYQFFLSQSSCEPRADCDGVNHYCPRLSVSFIFKIEGCVSAHHSLMTIWGSPICCSRNPSSRKRSLTAFSMLTLCVLDHALVKLMIAGETSLGRYLVPRGPIAPHLDV